MTEGPDLAVIDRAIELIRSGYVHYCCWALDDAAKEQGSEYRLQFDMFFAGRRPYWWSRINHGSPGKRVKALKEFRQACIDAAKEQK